MEFSRTVENELESDPQVKVKKSRCILCGVQFDNVVHTCKPDFMGQDPLTLLSAQRTE